MYLYRVIAVAETATTISICGRQILHYNKSTTWTWERIVRPEFRPKETSRQMAIKLRKRLC